MKQINAKLIIPLISIFFSLGQLIYLLPNRFFNTDELQHTHVAWNIKEGLRIYKDFFEHHGPMYGEVNAVIWKIFNLPDTITTYYVFRGLNFLGLALILFLLTLIAKKLDFSRSVQIFSIAILLGITSFVHKCIEVRPDVWMSVFILVGIYTYIRNSKVGNIATIITWTIAIIYHLKAVIFIAPFLLLRFLTTRNNQDKYIITGLTTGILLIGLYMHLYLDIIDEYWYAILNVFILPISVARKATVVPHFFNIQYLGIIYLSVCTLSIITLAKKRIISYNKIIFSLISTCLLVSGTILLLGRHTQWMIMIFPLSSLLVGFIINEFTHKSKIISNSLVAILFVVLGTANFNYNKQHIDKNNKLAKNHSEIDQYADKETHLLFFHGSSKIGYAFRKSLLYKWYPRIKHVMGKHELSFMKIVKQRLNEVQKVVVIFPSLEDTDYISFPSFEKFLKNNFAPVYPKSMLWQRRMDIKSK